MVSIIYCVWRVYPSFDSDGTLVSEPVQLHLVLRSDISAGTFGVSDSNLSSEQKRGLKERRKENHGLLGGAWSNRGLWMLKAERRVQGCESVCCGVLGIPLLEKFLGFWFLCDWFLGFLVFGVLGSCFFRFLVS